MCWVDQLENFGKDRDLCGYGFCRRNRAWVCLLFRNKHVMSRIFEEWYDFLSAADNLWPSSQSRNNPIQIPGCALGLHPNILLLFIRWARMICKILFWFAWE
jgi:hypothetical protein